MLLKLYSLKKFSTHQRRLSVVSGKDRKKSNLDEDENYLSFFLLINEWSRDDSLKTEEGKRIIFTIQGVKEDEMKTGLNSSVGNKNTFKTVEKKVKVKFLLFKVSKRLHHFFIGKVFHATHKTFRFHFQWKMELNTLWKSTSEKKRLYPEKEEENFCNYSR